MYTCSDEATDMHICNKMYLSVLQCQCYQYNFLVLRVLKALTVDLIRHKLINDSSQQSVELRLEEKLTI